MWESRWLGLVLSLWMLGCAGMSGSFALYSPLLKEVGNYDQKQIAALAVAKDLGEALGILPGLLCDQIPTWLMLLIGSSHFFVGFGALWMICSRLISPPGFLEMFTILLVASQGTAWINTATLVTCIRNFPKSRGTVVGLLKSLVGLSSAIYKQLYSALLAPNEAGFLCLLSILPLAVVLPSMMFLRPAHRSPNETLERESTSLRFLMASCLGIALYLSVINIIQEIFVLPEQVKLASLAGLNALFMLPLLVPFHYWRRDGDLSLCQPQVASNEDHTCERVPTIIMSLPRAPRQLAEPLLARTESVDSIFDLSPRGQDQAKPQDRGQEAVSNGAETDTKHEASSSSDNSKEVDLPQHGETLGGVGSQVLPFVHEQPSDTSVPPLLSSLEDGDVQHTSLRCHVPVKQPDALLRRRSSKVLLAVSEGAVRSSKRKGPRRGEDFKLWQAVVKADFWLLAIAFMCGSGTALAAINNLAQMGLAQGYGNVRIFVSLISIWSFLGRLGGGYLSEEMVRNLALPRPIALLCAQLVMCIGHICFAAAFDGSLHVGCILIGLGYGVHWSIMPATVSELFGLLNFGILFNTVAATMPLGSFLFSSLIAGTLYDYEARRPGLHSVSGMPASDLNRSALFWKGETPVECTGAHCFRLTFICMFAACCLGCLMITVLVLRTRQVYKKLYSGYGASLAK